MILYCTTSCFRSHNESKCYEEFCKVNVTENLKADKKISLESKEKAEQILIEDKKQRENLRSAQDERAFARFGFLYRRTPETASEGFNGLQWVSNNNNETAQSKEFDDDKHPENKFEGFSKGIQDLKGKKTTKESGFTKTNQNTEMNLKSDIDRLSFQLIKKKRRNHLRELLSEGKLNLESLRQEEQEIFFKFVQDQKQISLWMPIWGIEQGIVNLEVEGNSINQYSHLT